MPAAAPARGVSTPPPSSVVERSPHRDDAAPVFSADYLHNPAPPYPPLARRMNESGRVLLRVYVEANGSAGHVELRQSSGSPRLDTSALETVRRWRFIPARRGGEPVGAWVLVPIHFSLGAS